MRQKKLILLFIIIFIGSSAWLFRASDKFLDPDFEKNWWSAYFTEPQSDKLDFIIENHDGNEVFEWKALDDEVTLSQGTVEIKKGTTEEIAVDASVDNDRITIEITSGQENKKIYKNYYQKQNAQ